APGSSGTEEVGTVEAPGRKTAGRDDRRFVPGDPPTAPARLRAASPERRRWSAPPARRDPGGLPRRRGPPSSDPAGQCGRGTDPPRANAHWQVTSDCLGGYGKVTNVGQARRITVAGSGSQGAVPWDVGRVVHRQSPRRLAMAAEWVSLVPSRGNHGRRGVMLAAAALAGGFSFGAGAGPVPSFTAGGAPFTPRWLGRLGKRHPALS